MIVHNHDVLPAGFHLQSPICGELKPFFLLDHFSVDNGVQFEITFDIGRRHRLEDFLFIGVVLQSSENRGHRFIRGLRLHIALIQ